MIRKKVQSIGIGMIEEIGSSGEVSMHSHAIQEESADDSSHIDAAIDPKDIDSGLLVG